MTLFNGFHELNGLGLRRSKNKDFNFVIENRLRLGVGKAIFDQPSGIKPD